MIFPGQPCEGRHGWVMLEGSAVLHSNGVIDAVGDYTSLRRQNPEAVVIGDGTTNLDRDTIRARLEENMSRPATEFETELRRTAEALQPHLRKLLRRLFNHGACSVLHA